MMKTLYRLLIIVDLCLVVVLARGTDVFHAQLPETLQRYVEEEVPPASDSSPFLIGVAAAAVFTLFSGSLCGLLVKPIARYLLGISALLAFVVIFLAPMTRVYSALADTLSSVAWLVRGAVLVLAWVIPYSSAVTTRTTRTDQPSDVAAMLSEPGGASQPTATAAVATPPLDAVEDRQPSGYGNPPRA